MILADITEFMESLVQMIVSGLANIFNQLNSITFAGTSVLKVILTCTILSVFLPTLLTIPQNTSRIATKISRRKNKSDKKSK